MIIVLVAVGLAAFSYANITWIPHVFIHTPGECHIDSECKFSEVCVRECLKPHPNGEGCLERAELGKCAPFSMNNTSSD